MIVMRAPNTLITILLCTLFSANVAANPEDDKLTGHDLLADERNTINVFQSSAPSVVFVVNRGVQRDLFSGRTEEFLRGTGSGFVWDRDGHVVTNYHVVQGAQVVSVLIDNQEYRARVLGVEPRRDIAVLALEIDRRKTKLEPIKLGESRHLLVGQKVVAIGSPFGFDRTLTTGVISALGREIVGIAGVTIPDMIQTDASINPGNSGGPLLNSSGDLIGMNTMIYSQSGTSAGIGFAVPANLIRRIVPQIIKFGKAVTPTLEVRIFGDEVTRNLGLQGVLIHSVTPGSHADKAGLRGTRDTGTGAIELGDVIIGVGKKTIRNYDDLYNALDSYSPNDEVTVYFVRSRKKMKATVRLVAN